MKSVNIQGKEYFMVHERVLEFHKLYPEGSITTELVSSIDSEMVVVKATVTAKGRIFTGYSQASWNDTKSKVNTTSALENAETSAVGRALGFLGIGIDTGFASADEVDKATNTTPYNERLASEKQVALIERLVSQIELPDIWLKKHGLESFDQIKFKDVNKLLAELK